MGSELDVYWVQLSGADPVKWCKKLDGRLKIIHLKDIGVVLNKMCIRDSFYDELFFCVDKDVIAITKATMELAGTCKRWMKRPTASVTDEEMEVIKDVLKRHNITL